ncbi:TPA: DUF551 domain-containing protein [Enterobacter cloacae subsp. cloacae]|uniref:DUF551 domain-containing protein n=1 Tax=Enterobacter cloacae TaxID=550 RepID=UPI0021C250C1|nr:DUF551 domain-containing protein [Enterobacter cloacae]UXL11532.1 DUF551 domain-containing protein [Enterobacter cloacae]HDS3501893.1 DUF551 domain-containing protein [Enterobacter cloacae]
MSTITKERLTELSRRENVGAILGEEIAELARIALASLEAEPVAWLLSGGGAKNNVSFDCGNAYADPLREVTPLYTAPPAPVALTSGYSDFEEIWSSSTHPLTQDDEMKDFAWDIWNACRAAMLQGAERVTTANKLPDGWVACSERLPPEGYETDGGAICYLVWHKNEVDCGPQYSISNVFFLRKHWEKNFTHWMPLPAAPQQEVK